MQARYIDYSSSRFTQAQLVTSWRRMKKLRDANQHRPGCREAYLFYRAELMAIEEELRARGMMSSISGDMDTQEMPSARV